MKRRLFVGSVTRRTYCDRGNLVICIFVIIISRWLISMRELFCRLSSYCFSQWKLLESWDQMYFGKSPIWKSGVWRAHFAWRCHPPENLVLILNIWFQLWTQHQFLGPWPRLEWHSVQGHERSKLSSHNTDIMLGLCLANEIVSCCAASHEDKYISNGGDNNARHLLGSNPTQLILQPVARLSFSEGRHHHHQEQAT